MPEQNKPPPETGQPTQRDDPDAKIAAPTADKPPESAENFEHVIRRLAIERDRLRRGGG